jgi:hypothetical protein
MRGLPNHNIVRRLQNKQAISIRRAHNGEIGVLHEGLERASDVADRASSTGGVTLAHGIKAGPLHEKHSVCANGLIKLAHLLSRAQQLKIAVP